MIVTLFNVFLTCVNIPLFQVYKSFSDAVLLDWFISLTDKDMMSQCDIAQMQQNAIYFINLSYFQIAAVNVDNSIIFFLNCVNNTLLHVHFTDRQGQYDPL